MTAAHRNAKSFLQGLKPTGCERVMSELKLRPLQNRGTGMTWYLSGLIKVGLVICVLGSGVR